MKRLLLIAAFLLAPSLALAQGLAVSVPNAGTTGTTLNSLAKLTGAPSTAVKTATTDTSGAEGIVVSGAGTSGNALIVKAGQPSCNFDGATTAGDWVQISGTTAGDCHDAGSVFPVTGQVIGRVLSTNAAAGLYPVNVGGGAQGNAVANGGTGASSGSVASANLSFVYVACNPTLSAVTGTTTETVIAACQIPANLLGANGSLNWSFYGTFNAGNTDAKTWTARYGAANNTSGTSCGTLTTSNATIIAGIMAGQILAKGATNSQSCQVFNGFLTNNMNSSADVSTAVDTTATSWLVITGTLGTTTDTMTARTFVVRLNPVGGN